MNDLSIKIKAELENIDQIFQELPNSKKLYTLSNLELAGVAALLHNFYNRIENILKQILISMYVSIPEGKTWHKYLLNLAEEKSIINKVMKHKIGEYLAFIHFFSHAYALDLYAEKMESLVKSSESVYTQFKMRGGYPLPQNIHVLI